MMTMKLTPAMLTALTCHTMVFEDEEPECPATFAGLTMTFAAEDRMALYEFLTDAANSADEMVPRGEAATADRRMSTSLSRLASKVLRA